MGEKQLTRMKRDGNQCVTRSRREHAYADEHIYTSEREIGMVVFWKNRCEAASCCVGSKSFYNTFMLSCFLPFFPSFNQKILISIRGLQTLRTTERIEGKRFYTFRWYNKHTVLIHYTFHTVSPFRTSTQAKHLLSHSFPRISTIFAFTLVFIQWKITKLGSKKTAALEIFQKFLSPWLCL